MPQVQIPNIGIVNFPDSMSQDEIASSIKTKIIPQHQAKMQSTASWILGPGKASSPNEVGPDNISNARMGLLGMLGDVQTGLQHQAPPQAQTVAQGTQNFGINTISSLTNPKTAAIGLGLGGLGLVPKLGVPLARLAMLMLGTKVASEGLGQASPGSGATPGERTEGLLNTGMGGLMALGGALPAVKAEVPVHLQAVPQRPLTVPEINLRAGLEPRQNKSAIALSSGQPLDKTPGAFEKGKVLSTEVPRMDVPATKLEITKIPTEQLSQRYQDVQAGAKVLMQQGRLPEANNLIVRGQFLREELERRQAPKPSESSPAENPVVPPPVKAEVTPPALTFKPAVRVEGKVTEGAHGAAAQKVFNDAQKAGVAKPKVERGFVDSSGAWYASPMEVARKQMEQQASKPKVTNEKENETQAGLQPLGVQRREGTLPKEEPGNVGTGERGSQQSDARGKGQALTKEEKAVEQERLRGELGFTITPKSMWESLFSNKTTKVDPQQMFNRIKNKLGESSSTFQWLASQGLQGFLSQPRTTQEVQKWAEENQPKVEVRKFGAEIPSDVKTRYQQLTHNLDTKYPGWFDEPEKYHKDPEFSNLFEKWQELNSNDLDEEENTNISHWQSIAPKSETDMPGYVEIAVVKPVPNRAKIEELANKQFDLSSEQGARDAMYRQRDIDALASRLETREQFPSSHNFPPNTLGFVRGYMETVNGKKVFHVIEVQSDWAQKLREDLEQMQPHKYENEKQMEGVKQAWRDAKGDPLLPHYERLALKAAIEHARQEGAEGIVISDAETAMMTEGHDRGYDGPGNREIQGFGVDAQGNSIVEPTQSAGMRLHYDQTLPKIASELTGEKGERVEMGEHQMASGHPENLNDVPGPRKDLIFRNPDGTPKTSVTGRMFPLEKTNKEFTFFGKDRPSEAGFVDIGAIAETIQDFAKKKLGPAWEEFKKVYERHVLRASGESLPFHAQQDKELGNKAYLVGQAPAIANRLAEVDPKIVLNGAKPDSEFDQVVGSVWTEAQLRDKRSLLQEQGRDEEARKVETVVGNGRSPIKDETHYQALLRNPQVQEATMDFKRLIGNKVQARQENLGGKIARQPGMGFVNLLIKDEPKQVATSGLRGAQLKGSALNRTRTGTGTSYDTSATRMMQNAIKANYYRSALADYYKDAEKKGVGLWVKAGEKVPEGYVAVPQDITKLIIKDEEGGVMVKTIRKDFYLKKEVMPEFRRITNLDRDALIQNDHKLAEFLTKLQVEAGIDALGHSGNIVAAVNSAAKADLGKNIIVGREASTIADITKIVGQELGSNPEFLHVAHQMAERGILREAHTMQGLLGEFSPGGAIIKHLDTAGRQVLYRAAVDMANSGLGKADVIDIRRQIDKQLGQYNPRLMTAWQHIMRSVFSPFSVASRTFNSLATQRLLLSPGFQAANKTAWAKLAARQLAYAATAYFVAPMVLNYEQTGEVFPEGVKFGEGVLSKNKDGTYKTFDFLKLNFLRRALRVTGAGKFIEGQVLPRLRGEPVQGLDSTARAATMDVIGGKIAPFTAGPIPQAATALVLGKSPAGFDLREKGENQPPYFKAALRTLNPVSGALMQGASKGDTAAPLIKRLEQTVGIGSSSKPEQVINGLRRQFLYKLGKAKQADYPPSDYDTLKSLLAKGETEEAKKEYEKLLATKTEEHQFGKDPEGEARKQLQTYFTTYAKGHGNVSKEDEAAFVKTLSPHQVDLYNEVMKQKQTVADAFFALQPKQSKKGNFGFGSLKF